jgi:hypothetical protein
MSLYQIMKANNMDQSYKATVACIASCKALTASQQLREKKKKEKERKRKRERESGSERDFPKK